MLRAGKGANRAGRKGPLLGHVPGIAVNDKCVCGRVCVSGRAAGECSE